MGCGCGNKNSSQATKKQSESITKKASPPKTPLQTRKERVNKLVSIPGTKPK